VLPRSLDYTDKDFDSLRARFISLIKSVPNFAGWTDFSPTDPGTYLVEAACFIGDILAFNMDANGREAKWGTASQRRSLLRLAKQIAYKPLGASAGRAVVTVTVTGHSADVTYSHGSIIKTKSLPSVDFQTLTDLVLTVTTPTNTVEVENSTNCSETYSATLAANQKYTLRQSPYLEGSLQFSTAEGDWDEVVDFLKSKASSRHYTVDVDSEGVATLTFGDGVVGAIPSGEAALSYKIGGGLAGKVEAGAICDPQGTFYDALGDPVTITATNADRAVGADDPETVASIKVRAPATLKLGNRTVSREDFETVARGVTGVGRALMLAKAQDPAVDHNCGALWIVPTGLGFLTPSIRTAITTAFVTYPYGPSFALDVFDPWYLDVTVAARVYLGGSSIPALVKADILKNLQAWFALTTTDADGNVVDNPNVNFGYYVQDVYGDPVGSLALSDLFNVIRDTAGVRKIGGNPEDFQLSSARVKTSGSTVVQTSGYHDLTIMPREFPRFAALTLVNGDTGETL